MRSLVVSIIGRPNVGKSTIFNRLIKSRNQILTYDLPGVTRDRHYGIMNTGYYKNFEAEDLILVDTGGFYPEEVHIDETLKKKHSYEPFFNIMRDQAKIAIAESDLILFVVDARDGLLPDDKIISNFLRATNKPYWLVVNKFDSDTQWGSENDFYQLGIKQEELILTSAEHNRGLEEIREKLCVFSHEKKAQMKVETYLDNGSTPHHEVVASVAIIGAPNAGKSTLLNKLLGTERALVSEIAGTTVDPIEGYFDIDFGNSAAFLKEQRDIFRQHNIDLLKEFQEFVDESEQEQEKINEDEFELDENFVIPTEEEEREVEIEYNQPSIRTIKIVDTAGIRRSANVKGHIESQSVYRSLRAITDSDVVICLCDATKGITHQDRRLLDIALEKGKSVIICLNKVDLIDDILKDKEKKKNWFADLRADIPWLEFCELVPLSALKGSHIKLLKRAIMTTVLIRNKKIPTGKLNRAIETLINRSPVVVENARGVHLNVKYASMVKSAPPTFLLFSNKSKGIPTHYRRYLVNGIRREFSMINTPVHLIFRTANDIKRKLNREQKETYQELT